jgi:hypothetical protein
VKSHDCFQTDGVVNDKSEKIETLDHVIRDKKQLNLAIFQVGGLPGRGGRLAAVSHAKVS